MNRKGLFFTRLLTAGLVMASFLAISGQAKAAYQIGDDESYLKIGGLLQGWMTLTEDGAPNGKDLETEFYLRRMRLMFYGQINKWVNFFVETDNPNFGKGGNLTPVTFIQDAYLEFNLHPAIQVDVGMILVPFSHHGMQGATSLMGLDYHSSLIRYPGGSHKVWRDFGVMLRGMPLGKWLEYRVGVFNGVHGNAGPKNYTDFSAATDPRNPKDLPRITGRLTFNIFEEEGGAGVGGMFYDGIYLKNTDEGVVSTKQVLSVGVSVDWQKDLNAKWGAKPDAPADPNDPLPTRSIDSRDDYLAVAGDIFADIPLDAKKLWSLNGQVNFYFYSFGDRKDGDTWLDSTGDAASYTGVGLSSELGLRYDRYQPVILVDWYNAIKAPGGNTGDFLGIYGGFNYWLFGHSTSIKVQFGGESLNGNDDWGLAGKLQAQLLF